MKVMDNKRRADASDGVRRIKKGASRHETEVIKMVVAGGGGVTWQGTATAIGLNKQQLRPISKHDVTCSPGNFPYATNKAK